MRAHAISALSTTLCLCANLNAARAADPAPNNGELAIDIDVISRRLDEARQQIQPNLDATSYTFSLEALQNVPQGEAAPLNQVLLQAPGVAQDSFGQIHLRGEHANVQFRSTVWNRPRGCPSSARSSPNVSPVA